MRRLQRGLRLAARDVEGGTGLSAAQLFVLEQLHAAHATSLSHLAKRTMTDPSSVSVVVERLVGRGLARRVASRRDRRRMEVRITPAGRQVLDRAPKPPTDLLLAALRQMPRARAQQLAAALGQLNDVLGFGEAGLLFDDDEQRS